jgi:WD40 repeat protein
MPNGESILCRFQDENGNDTNQFAIWNIFNSQIAYTFKIEDEIAKVLCITPGGGGILFTLSGNRLGLFSITSGENICRCSGHDDEIVSADISKNEKYMVSLAKDHCIKLWDALTGECIQSHNCVAGNDGKAAFSYNSKWYYYNHEEKIWCARSIESGAIERVYAVERVPYRRASIHQPPPTCISNFYTVSSDGNYALATYEWYKEAEIWYLKDNTAECIQGLKGVQYGKFSSDNQHLFAMTAKKFTAVYSIKEKRVVNRFNMTFRAISNDATYALDQYARLYILHWKYRFPGWADWDEGALPYWRSFDCFTQAARKKSSAR